MAASKLTYSYDDTTYEGFCRVENSPNALPLDCQLALVWEEGNLDTFAVQGKEGADNLMQYLQDSWYGDEGDWIAPPVLFVKPTAEAIQRAQQQSIRVANDAAFRQNLWFFLTENQRLAFLDSTDPDERQKMWAGYVENYLATPPVLS